MKLLPIVMLLSAALVGMSVAQSLEPRSQEEKRIEWVEGLGNQDVEVRRAAAEALFLDRKGPTPRHVEPPTEGRVVAIPQVAGLHHRYTRAA